MSMEQTDDAGHAGLEQFERLQCAICGHPGCETPNKKATLATRNIVPEGDIRARAPVSSNYGQYHKHSAHKLTSARAKFNALL